MRERGLKPYEASLNGMSFEVAPHAGAWIETKGVKEKKHIYQVAPHAGAWIETKGTIAPRHHLVGRSPCGSVD